jgi:hypothetical protein
MSAFDAAFMRMDHEELENGGRSVSIPGLRGYLDWLEKMEWVRREIHSAPRRRRWRSFKRCIRVMRKKGFSDEFIGVAMEPFFVGGEGGGLGGERRFAHNYWPLFR